LQPTDEPSVRKKQVGCPMVSVITGGVSTVE